MDKEKERKEKQWSSKYYPENQRSRKHEPT